MAARETAAEREARMDRAAAGGGRDRDAPPARRATRPVRTKPVRLTVDMTPALHRRLKAWTAAAADELDMADVAAAEVVRVMVAHLTSPDGETVDGLSQAVLAELRRKRDE